MIGYYSPSLDSVISWVERKMEKVGLVLRGTSQKDVQRYKSEEITCYFYSFDNSSGRTVNVKKHRNGWKVVL